MTRYLLAALLLAAACGTGTDGKPVAPPTTPEPAPAPAPPGIPIVRLAERGPGFLVWEWDPVEGATGYQVVVSLDDTPASERPPAEFTEDTTFRVGGIEAGVPMRIYVRAIRETAGGQAEGSWSQYVVSWTNDDLRPLMACTDQRERALIFRSGEPQVVREWQPDRPIRFRVDAGPIIEGGLRIVRPNFLEEEILGPLRDMARRLEERLGYPVMDPDALPGGNDYTVTVRWRDHVWSPGWGEPQCPGHVGSPWNAQASPPATFMNRYFFDPEITCGGYVGHRDSETIIHELGHVFGMDHDPRVDEHTPPGSLAMSDPLTRIIGGDSDAFLLVEDLDNIGCVFPHPDFPRQ